jgi:NAD(P)-dependent dehydrogenase (short-subunit alcohol dehydrogenase family)
MPDFKGKVALVTGAASGIGRESALAFARAGAKVVCADVTQDAGEETVKMIKDMGGDATFVKCDVSQDAQVKALVDKAVELYGHLDFAHNNAGIEGAMGFCKECTEENWDRTIAINLKGVFLCCKYEIPYLIKNGGGAIVNTASVAGLVGFPGLPAYCASKGGVVQLTKTLALEVATENIRVNAVCPGVIKTPMIDRLTNDDPAALKSFTDMEPVGRLGSPAEIADVVVYLCSDEASFVTGVPMPVDGAFIAQ